MRYPLPIVLSTSVSLCPACRLHTPCSATPCSQSYQQTLVGICAPPDIVLSPCSQVMGKNKVLVKVHPEGKYVVDLDKSISIDALKPGARVALRNDSYTLHLVLPTKVDPLVSLMKVEKVPDSTYDMVGGADQQIKEIKEVRTAA